MEVYNIYFNENKEAFAFEIEDPICVITSTEWEKYAGTDKWDIVAGKFVDITDTEEYRKKKEAEERAEINALKCTKRVFILSLEKLGLDYFEQIEPLINENRQAKLEWSLCVELERSNPLLDIIGRKLGITSEQLDNLFKLANDLISEEEFIPAVSE